MRAGQITARGRIALVEVDEPPSPRDGEAIVAPETGCLCGSDSVSHARPQDVCGVEECAIYIEDE